MMPSRRKQEVEKPKHRLFHLAGISGAADQDQLLGEIDGDDRLAPAAMPLGVGAEAGQVDDRIFRTEVGKLVGFGANKQGANEQIVPGEFVYDAHADPVLGLRAAVEILDEQGVLLAKRNQEILVQPVERFRVHRLVHRSPPDCVVGEFVADNELVLGTSAGVVAGLDDERPVFGEKPFLALDGKLYERCRRQVPVKLGRGDDALCVQSVFRDPIGHLFPFHQ